MIQTVKPLSRIATKWGVIEGFTKREFRPLGVAEDLQWDIHAELIYKLKRIRDRAIAQAYGAKIRIVIKPNGGFAVNGHSDTSLHGGVPFETLDGIRYGRAADFSIQQNAPESGKWETWPWLKQLLLVHPLAGPECGIGAYPWWNSPGLHLDFRGPGIGLDGQEEKVRDRTPAIWWRDPDDKYKFYPYWHIAELVTDVFGLGRST